MNYPANYAQNDKTKIHTLQDNTAYNASSLNGSIKKVSDFKAVWVWFTPVGGYDGTVHFEISPDGGTTWFATSAYDPSDRTTAVTTVASPVANESYIVPMPSYSHVRVRMSGGTAGSLTVYLRLIDYSTSF
jgi:hypothetical protein